MRRGLRHLFYFQVDNPLVEMCDPFFLGHHILAKSEATTLAIAKTDPLERVGNIVQIDGKTQIIEYSDLPAEMARVRTTMARSVSGLATRRFMHLMSSF